MRIILNYEFTQPWQTCLQRVPVLLLLNHAQCFSANHIGSWQIRFAQSETYIARLRSICYLTNRASLDSAQECGWLKLFLRFHRYDLASPGYSPGEFFRFILSLAPRQVICWDRG